MSTTELPTPRPALPWGVLHPGPAFHAPGSACRHHRHHQQQRPTQSGSPAPSLPQTFSPGACCLCHSVCLSPKKCSPRFSTWKCSGPFALLFPPLPRPWGGLTLQVFPLPPECPFLPDTLWLSVLLPFNKTAAGAVSCWTQAYLTSASPPTENLHSPELAAALSDFHSGSTTLYRRSPRPPLHFWDLVPPHPAPFEKLRKLRVLSQKSCR